MAVLAAYFSDVRLNIFACIEDVCERTGVTPASLFASAAA